MTFPALSLLYKTGIIERTTGKERLEMGSKGSYGERAFVGG